MKIKSAVLLLSLVLACPLYFAQLLQLPDGGLNIPCSAGRTIGVTAVEVKWNAPAVRGREGKIWGTQVVPYGFTVLGFGSNLPSPWRAGANECTTLSFSTDVQINGKELAAGTYAFFIAVYEDSCVLIFNKNTSEWGTYFYDPNLDVMRVKTVQEKNLAQSKERLDYVFSKQTDHSAELALEWEKWRIPLQIEVDLKNTTLASIRRQMSGAMGFDPSSLEAAATWCLQNETNYDQALVWISSATGMGGIKTYNALSTKAELLIKTGKAEEGHKIKTEALENATAMEMHAYGRRLLSEKRNQEALDVFMKNHQKHKGAWPTNVGLMRGYSATGDLKKALKYAKLALPQAPNDENKNVLEMAIILLESGKAL